MNGLKSKEKAVRTDMAYELKSRHAGEIPGVRCGKENLRGLEIFSVDIFDNEGAEILGKPQGLYYTLNLPRWFDRGSECYCDTVQVLAELIRRCLPEETENVFVAALGNPDITPDALGTLAAATILVTRHLKQQEPEEYKQFCSLALCRPGVLGTSGMESAVQIKNLCREVEPQLVVVIDALAGSEADKLCRSVQVSNAGISPGSGVGNDRQELSMETLGIPVVSIGIPTVIDAAFLGDDALQGMFVTPRDVDSLVRHGARLIACALNLALHKGLTIEDVEKLTG